MDNPMFAKFDKALGKTTPTTGISTRADQIRKLAQNPIPETTSDAPEPSLDTSQEESGSGIGNFIKGVIRAPATMVARPIQLGYELLNKGDNTAEMDKFSKEKLGGIVAPIPKNAADLKKEIGRGVQTVALGMGPAAGGAAFGAGASMEEGNDLLSTKTALNIALGAAGGKVLDLVGKPIFNVAGKVVGEITPKYIKDLAGKGTKAIQEFAAHHEIFPEKVSKSINSVNKIKVGNTVKNAIKDEFNAAKSKLGIKKTVGNSAIDNRMNSLQKVEDSRSSIRNYVSKQQTRGFNPKQDIAATDLLKDSVDNTGTIRTKTPGGAIAQYNEFIKPQEDVVTKALAAEGKTVKFKDVKKELISSAMTSKAGANKLDAIAAAKREITALKLEVDKNGDIPLAVIHDAKVNKYSTINYDNPTSAKADKTIAKRLKLIVENNSSAPVKKLNDELSRHYANIGYLEKLDGAKVEGGRMKKHFAKVIGGMIGSHFGPLGTIGGSELAGKIAGDELSSTFNKGIGKDLTSSKLMTDTIQSLKKSRPLKTIQSTTKIKVKKPISKKIITKQDGKVQARILNQLRPAEKDFIKLKGIDINKLKLQKKIATASEIFNTLSPTMKKEILSKRNRITAKKSTSIPIIIKTKNGLQVLDGGHALAGKLKSTKKINYYIQK